MKLSVNMEDFVPYELAKKLKEKGFREKCYKHYYPNIKDWFISSLPECGNYSSYLDAPTISQVLKWLREEKKMFVQISLFQYCYDYCILDTEMVYYDNEHKVLHQGPTGYSYNEAALAGIEYILDNNLI